MYLKKTITNHFLNYFSILAFFLQSCHKDNIPSEFQKYVDSFIAEGAKRGLKLHSDNLTVKFNPNENGASQCTNLGTQEILINKPFWNSFNELERESLIFHELGHCILGLNHDNCLLLDGTSESMMCGIGGSCSIDYCFYPYGGMRREYYLDQLFDKNTPVPQWAKLDEFKDQYLNKQRSLIILEEFNDTSKISISGKFVAGLEIGKLNIDGNSFLQLKNFSKTDISQENLEIETSFKILDKSDNNIQFTWVPLFTNDIFNTYNIQISNTKDGYFLRLGINGLVGYVKNIDKHIKINNYNQFLMRRIGKMVYFYLNNDILYIQDMIPFSKVVIKTNDNKPVSEVFYLQTLGKCSLDYVKANKIIL